MLPDPLEACNLLVEISRSLTSELNDREIAETLLKRFLKIIPLKKAAFFFLNEEKERYDFYLGHHLVEADFKTIPMEVQAPFPEWLKNDHHLVFEGRLSKKLAETLSSLYKQTGLQNCLPFITQEKLIGFVFLCLPPLSSLERQLLLLIGEQIAIAIENNRLAQALKKSKVLVRRTDRLKSLETIAGGMAHEIRNPLTSIKTFVELAGERREDSDFFECFSKVAREDIGRIERIIREVLDYSRYMEPIFTEEDINEVIQTTLPFMVIEANKRGAKFIAEYQKNLPRIIIDRQQIKQVLLNLLINAIDALPPSDGIIKVKTGSFKKLEIPWVGIQIEDNGIGIPPENMENIFDPFFTTKHESKEREGTGLGLAIVHQIVQDHRGEVDVKSKPNVGTVFSVDLPSNPMLYERRKERRPEN
ncbi:MAG: GAF domain-containing sensor histidine kinase [Nitrospiria bacterium]